MSEEKEKYPVIINIDNRPYPAIRRIELSKKRIKQDYMLMRKTLMDVRQALRCFKVPAGGVLINLNIETDIAKSWQGLDSLAYHLNNELGARRIYYPFLAKLEEKLKEKEANE